MIDALHSAVAFAVPLLLVAAALGWVLRERENQRRYQRRMQAKVRDERDPRAR